MKTKTIATLAVLAMAFVASAEELVNEPYGVSGGSFAPGQSTGFIPDELPYRPSGVSGIYTSANGTYLSFPSSFAAAGITSVDGCALTMKESTAVAKFRALSDSLQGKSGTLHFRLLLKGNQALFDGFVGRDTLDSINNHYAAGLVWCTNDMVAVSNNDASWRCNYITYKAGSGATIERRLLFGFYKDAADRVTLRLCLSGSADRTTYSTVSPVTQTYVLVDNPSADETYVCYAQIEIDALGTQERIRAFAQPASDWSANPTWASLGGAGYAVADLIGGISDDAGALNGYLAFGGKAGAGAACFLDELAVATTRDEVVAVDEIGLPPSLYVYNGFPATKALPYYQGFTDANGSWLPSAGNYIKELTPGLSNPACFAEVSAIPAAGGNGLYVDSSAYGGAMSGSKVLTLSDNLQTASGELVFKCLVQANQTSLDNLSNTADCPVFANSQSCGLIWSTDDYYEASKTNASLRLTGVLEKSRVSNVANKGIDVRFGRALFFSCIKNQADGKPRIVLYIYDDSATSVSAGFKTITLVDEVVADKTYVCCAKIKINAFSDGADKVMAFAQPTDTYDAAAPWAAVVEANLIGGVGDWTPSAQLLVYGKNWHTGSFLWDEIGLANAESPLVVHAAVEPSLPSVVLAKDGFLKYSETCKNGYTAGAAVKNQAAVSESAVNFGFKDLIWKLPISKSVPLYADSYLSFPASYAAQGIVATDGTSFSFASSQDQVMYAYKAFTDNLLCRRDNETLHVRFLMSVTEQTLDSLVSGPDEAGTFMMNGIGVTGKVNYLGAGINAWTLLEGDNSMEPGFNQRGNAAYVTFTKNQSGNVGLYLTLFTNGSDAQTSYKMADIPASGFAAAAGTYLCYIQIKINAGTDGKEEIRAFAEKVDKIGADGVVRSWTPAKFRDAPIEHELISSSAYPTHVVTGGKVHPGFTFDEFLVSVGDDASPAVWAFYRAQKPRGMALIYR